MSTFFEGLKWSKVDFEQMGWHDVHLYGVAAVPDRFELYFDIDYIVEWICPPSTPGSAQFRIAPATVKFENVSGVSIAVESQQGAITIREVDRTKRESLPADMVETWHWVFKCGEGVINFETSGFQIALRQQPILSEVQYLSVDQRGLPSFAGPAQ